MIDRTIRAIQPTLRNRVVLEIARPVAWRLLDQGRTVRSMTPEELLTTTRSVRRRLDLTRPVPATLIHECIEIAVQAPTGSNRQQWQWLVVTNPDTKRFIGERYRESWYAYNAAGRAEYPEGDPRRAQLPRVVRSAHYLAEHMGEVPVMVIPCIHGRVDGQDNLAIAGLYGSIVPAAWSFMLAARLRGLGSAYTTLHLKYEREVAEQLEIPYEQYTQAALLPVAYYTGDTFRVAERVPLDGIVRWERW
jgi:nitroreductase